MTTVWQHSESFADTNLQMLDDGRSLVFQAMFYGTLAEPSDVINIPDIEEPILRILLQKNLQRNTGLIKFPNATRDAMSCLKNLAKGGLEREKSCIIKAIHVPFKPCYVFFISIIWSTCSYFPSPAFDDFLSIDGELNKHQHSELVATPTYTLILLSPKELPPY
ncbi:hypothetical protein DPMN_146113 [Dreissena polymorpha]|uniref:Uncharacterized protein n=1 Tax=Dreissena polymorpha TaxID=45954 RepID=A0A9D4F7B7_DREPO|nr:hypothetical protein DPMN_146113 [Dreissena polymorpha]